MSDAPELLPIWEACTFCRREPEGDNRMIAGQHAAICHECLDQCLSVVARSDLAVFEQMVESARNTDWFDLGVDQEEEEA